MDNEKKTIKRKLKGEVVSNKMEKTVVVKVDRFKLHPTYQKRYRVSKKYKAHDPKNQCKVGDTVEIIESKPISKDKRWKVVYQNN
ncbi:30S ribosomal protein S17 [Candidatus Falkowbacteria bacterium]|uniref:Small ribosomal subunit protein uS17 n=1 Tax=Candidatus Buchananbacteria bacterium CG10_big_fil_rev_8_21_14_0_10_33_19 TaxID=1974525 RepID=A0A2H0W2Z1_9BACT|nr:30S ribosomal protein S17 [Candidatus Falkowbacteria bacterium]PIS05733.1 MAG: 30S ribosomal protein S17 [Candidatus Buchananbacteria bacterium CG10_big_fil_rev_8_21_14_0_10_33_19]